MIAAITATIAAVLVARYVRAASAAEQERSAALQRTIASAASYKGSGGVR